MRLSIQYNTIQYNTIHYNTVQYSTIQYSAIQYNTIQYNQYNTRPRPLVEEDAAEPVGPCPTDPLKKKKRGGPRQAHHCVAFNE